MANDYYSIQGEQRRRTMRTRRTMLKIMAAGGVITPAAIAAKPQKLTMEAAGNNASLVTANGTITGPYVEKNFTYIVQSQNQAYPNSVRILLPDQLDAMQRPKIVYVLPVNPDTRVQWNDGLITFRTLNLHNRYNVIAVAPS